MVTTEAEQFARLCGRVRQRRDAQLLEVGLLRGSLVPPPVIRELRDLTRYVDHLDATMTSIDEQIDRKLVPFR